jgi:hypothetical protein
LVFAEEQYSQDADGNDHSKYFEIQSHDHDPLIGGDKAGRQNKRGKKVPAPNQQGQQRQDDGQ